jgi:hypothetical protein
MICNICQITVEDEELHKETCPNSWPERVYRELRKLPNAEEAIEAFDRWCDEECT